jgi:hypothetical protein
MSIGGQVFVDEFSVTKVWIKNTTWADREFWEWWALDWEYCWSYKMDPQPDPPPTTTAAEPPPLDWGLMDCDCEVGKGCGMNFWTGGEYKRPAVATFRIILGPDNVYGYVWTDEEVGGGGSFTYNWIGFMEMEPYMPDVECSLDSIRYAAE